MQKKIKNWIQAQRKDIKKLLIGGAILAFYILIAKLFGQETDIGVVEAFFVGMLLAAIFVNAYRFYKRTFKK
ncbi:hypothetical protein HYW17_00100 [Candidatus Uhrbacteria bacterium]|nr:hypothetical protein [Candidatus Uhrbacteria bacterium]